MKKLLYGILLFSTGVLANPHGCAIKDTLFFSYTLDHKKVIELCRHELGYRFTFGYIGRPEISLYRTKFNIFRLRDNGGVFRVINGSHSFTVVEGDRKFINSELIIMERGDFLLRIPLDTESAEYINKTFGWVI